MQTALSVVLKLPTHAAPQHFAHGRLEAGAGGTAGGSQGFGPRLGRGVSGRRQALTAAAARSQQQGAAAAAAAGSSAAAAAGQHPLLVVGQQQEPQQTPKAQQQQQQQPGISRPDTAAAPVAATAADGNMHGGRQQGGLPSSRSDTMLLQTAEQQRNGRGSGGGGGAGAGVRANRRDQQSAAATAATGSGQQQAGGYSSIGNNIPVYVMLPLDTVNSDGLFRYSSSKWFSLALQRLAATGIRGVAVDVWWGAVERRPRRYDWSGYRQLFALVRALGLKLQVVMSFHACGGNVGDNAQIPLPQWVLQVGEQDPDIFFTDRPRDVYPGQRNKECLSFFADEEPGLLRGRSPMQCYVEFMRAFRDEFLCDLGPGLIEEVVVGCGPCGELRYPSYPEANGWRFPGVGEFQCYDRRALASLALAAREAGHPEWGNTGPHDTGNYNSSPEETGFFCSWGGNWETTYGRFFLEWYSNALLEHGERMLTAATSVFSTHRSAAEQGWPAVIGGGGRSRSLPDLPGSGGAGRQYAYNQSLPPLPAGMVEEQGPQQEGEQQQQQEEGGAAARSQQQQQQADEQQQQLPYSGTAFDAGLAGSYRLQQQQQQEAAAAASAAAAAAAAALRTSPSGDLLGTSGFAGPAAGAGAAGMGMRHHASYSSLRSSVSENEEWGGDGGVGGVPAGPPVDLTLKIAGVHWWFRTRSHAAELTAGYFNTDQRDGYSAILQLAARHGLSLTLTCVEMCDAQHPPEALCGPEGLLRQVRERAASIGVSVGGENALPCFMPNIIDETALHRIVYNTQPWGTPLQTGAGSSGLDPAGPVAVAAAASASAAAAAAATMRVPPSGTAAAAGSGGSSPVVGSPGSGGSSSELGTPSSGGSGTSSELPQAAKLPPMRAFTFLRLTDMMMTEDYQETWGKFMRMMQHNARRFRTSSTWRRGMGFE